MGGIYYTKDISILYTGMYSVYKCILVYILYIIYIVYICSSINIINKNINTERKCNCIYG